MFPLRLLSDSLSWARFSTCAKGHIAKTPLSCTLSRWLHLLFSPSVLPIPLIIIPLNPPYPLLFAYSLAARIKKGASSTKPENQSDPFSVQSFHSYIYIPYSLQIKNWTYGERKGVQSSASLSEFAEGIEDFQRKHW